MQRQAMQQLIQWKDNPRRKPLVLRGARQVGKTWLMRAFGEEHFTSTAYINFDRNERMEHLFEGDFSVDRLIQGLSIESGVTIEPDKTLIILDEIQEVPAALQSLKYFAEAPTPYFILAAGSLLGLTFHPGISFPVGKVDHLDLYPLNFSEFLQAIDEQDLLDLLEQRSWDLVTTFRDRYVAALKNYYFVGGMPEAVQEFGETGDYAAVRTLQKQLLQDYEADFSKHVPPVTVPRIRMVWNGIPSQLGKENKKFIYNVLKKGGRAKEFETAIQWLVDCGLCLRVDRVTKGGFPLIAYRDFGAFKLYLHDVGLLSAMVDMDEKTLLEGNSVFTEFKGALTEQYVAQQLVSEFGIEPFYWSAESSSNEVDFIMQRGKSIIPLEVKAAENLKSKSLKVFRERYHLDFGVRTSLSPYREEDNLINLPLYGLSQIMREIDQKQA